MNSIFHHFLFSLLLLPLLISSFEIDLEENLDDCILETKQLFIPSYPDAFNPSMIRYQDKILMIFRIRDPISKATNQMGLVFLDDDFNILSGPYLLNQELLHLEKRSMAQDPRLILIHDELYIVYNDTIVFPHHQIRRMHISKIVFDGFQFILENPEIILSFDQEIRNRHEKNWSPFIYENDLYLIHNISPHRILKPLFGTNECLTISETNPPIQWNYGELRGGTQAYLVGDVYLSFFHSSIDMQTVQSKGRKMTHYFMGAYTFSATPPFEIKSISPKPLFGKNFYNGEIHKTWKPLRVVFPGGLIFDEKTIFVTYGRQDHEIWIVKFDKVKLLNSLIEVTP